MAGEELHFSEFSKDISSALTDGVLSADEETQLLNKYEQETCEAHETCQTHISQLKKYIQIYQEAQTLSSESIMQLQKILSIPKSQRNGKLDDTLFAQFLNYSKEVGFSGTISQLIQKYASMREDFMKLSGNQRKEQQPEGGKDGEWGQSTFKYLLTQELRIGTVGDEIVQESEVPEQGMNGEIEVIEGTGSNIAPEKIPLDHHPDAVEIFALGMTQEAFEAEKTRLRQSPEYAEVRERARKLSRSEIQNIQEATGSIIDGGFGVETYLYYLTSPLASAGFSLEEVAKLEKIVELQDVVTIKNDITSSYGLPEGALDEIFFDISAGDALNYDPHSGQISLFDHETGRKTSIDVIEGIDDTIQSAFEGNDTKKILDTLARITEDGPRGHYIDKIFSYIDKYNAYAQARNIFCEIKGDMLYITDFANNHDLILKFRAFHLFGDQEVLMSDGKTYFRVGEEFVSSDKKRLSVTQGTQIQLLEPSDIQKVLEVHKLKIRREELQTKMTDATQLQTVLNSQDIESILEYVSIASSQEKKDLLESMKSLAFENHALFSSLRLIFCDLEGDIFTFKSFKDEPGVGDLFATGLTVFDLFGDYREVSVAGETYTSQDSKDYISQSGRKLIITEGLEITIPSDTKRRDETGFEKLQEYPELASKLGEWILTNYVNNGNNSCGASVGDALNTFGFSTVLPQSERHGYKWDEFLDALSDTQGEKYFMKVSISHPSEARTGGIIVFDEGATRGSSLRKQYGHVEIVGADGNFISYYSSNRPGGSSRSDAQGERYTTHTGFTGYVYYPIKKP